VKPGGLRCFDQGRGVALTEGCRAARHYAARTTAAAGATSEAM
jgi:hypothetical protein